MFGVSEASPSAGCGELGLAGRVELASRVMWDLKLWLCKEQEPHQSALGELPKG